MTEREIYQYASIDEQTRTAQPEQRASQESREASEHAVGERGERLGAGEPGRRTAGTEGETCTDLVAGPPWAARW